MLDGGVRKGTVSVDPEDESVDIDLKLAKTGETTRSWQKWFGALNVLLIRYERLRLLYFPLDEGRFLVLSTSPEADLAEVVDPLEEGLDVGTLARRIP